MYQHISRNVYYLRKEYGLSQKSLAKLLGIGVNKLRKIEKGDPFLTVYARTIRRLADVFFISSDAILFTDIPQAGDS